MTRLLAINLKKIKVVALGYQSSNIPTNAALCIIVFIQTGWIWFLSRVNLPIPSSLLFTHSKNIYHFPLFHCYVKDNHSWKIEPSLNKLQILIDLKKKKCWVISHAPGRYESSYVKGGKEGVRRLLESVRLEQPFKEGFPVVRRIRTNNRVEWVRSIINLLQWTRDWLYEMVLRIHFGWVIT